MFITLASEQFASWFSRGLTTRALSLWGGGRVRGWALYRGWGTEMSQADFIYPSFWLWSSSNAAWEADKCATAHGKAVAGSLHQDEGAQGRCSRLGSSLRHWQCHTGIISDDTQQLFTLCLCCSQRWKPCFPVKEVWQRARRGCREKNLVLYKKQLNPGGQRYSDNLFWAGIVFPASSFTYVSLCFKSALTQRRWQRLWSLN